MIEAAGGEPHNVGVEITNVTPQRLRRAMLTFEYKLLNLTGYTGPVAVTFQLSTSSPGEF